MSHNKEIKQLASGHQAGLQSSSKFREKEQTIKLKRKDDDRYKDPSLSGENAETVYRDRHGKKLDMLSEFMRQQATKDGQQYKIEQAQHSWGTGSVQKQELNEKLKELEEIKFEPFARTVEDPKLEMYKKEIIRDGDPMAAYFESKKAKVEEKDEQDEVEREEQYMKSSSSVGLPPIRKVPKKPKYKGPLPPPNRFKIMPGYRWDAVDRGNKFEHKLLMKMSEKGSKREDEYKYLSSDL